MLLGQQILLESPRPRREEGRFFPSGASRDALTRGPLRLSTSAPQRPGPRRSPPASPVTAGADPELLSGAGIPPQRAWPWVSGAPPRGRGGNTRTPVPGGRGRCEAGERADRFGRLWGSFPEAAAHTPARGRRGERGKRPHGESRAEAGPRRDGRTDLHRSVRAPPRSRAQLAERMTEGARALRGGVGWA